MSNMPITVIINRDPEIEMTFYPRNGELEIFAERRDKSGDYDMVTFEYDDTKKLYEVLKEYFEGEK